jgi:hypothetical protein
MNRKLAVLITVFAVQALALSAFGIPETALTRTQLLKDIERSSLTAGIGIEVELIENPAYIGDNLFGYVGYAPLDWLELGVGAHLVDLELYPSFEGKIDLVDIFANASRFSCLLMGGCGGFRDGLFFYQAGVGLNLRANRFLQLNLGAGGDSVSQAFSLQAGAFVSPLKSLGVSANAKLVIGPKGAVPVLSVAPLLILYPGKGRRRD